MKLTILFALILVIAVAYIQAQCPNAPTTPSCMGPKNTGTGNGTDCQSSAGDRWYFNSRTRKCSKMNYKGCAGNDNRWCSKASCEQGCHQ